MFLLLSQKPFTTALATISAVHRRYSKLHATMGSTQSSLKHDIAKKMKELLDLAPSDYQVRPSPPSISTTMCIGTYYISPCFTYTLEQIQ